MPVELVAVFAANPGLFFGTLFVLGAIIGSFLNVVIHRLPKMMEAQWRVDAREYLGLAAEPQPVLSLAFPASHCPSCEAPIQTRDNLPLIGWVLLGGRCRNCRVRIPVRYPVIELVAALLAVWVGWRFGPSAQTLAGLVLVWSLLTLALIDFETQLLPDDITQPLTWLGLVLALYDFYIPLEAAVVGAVAGYMSLWSLFQVYRLLTGKQAMGFGDFKLLAALGAWMGYALLPMIIVLSSAVGAVLGVLLIFLRRHDSQTPIPFGPFLAAAGVLAFLHGDDLNTVWLGWMLP